MIFIIEIRLKINYIMILLEYFFVLFSNPFNMNDRCPYSAFPYSIFYSKIRIMGPIRLKNLIKSTLNQTSNLKTGQKLGKNT